MIVRLENLGKKIYLLLLLNTYCNMRVTRGGDTPHPFVFFSQMNEPKMNLRPRDHP